MRPARALPRGAFSRWDDLNPKATISSNRVILLLASTQAKGYQNHG